MLLIQCPINLQIATGELQRGKPQYIRLAGPIFDRDVRRLAGRKLIKSNQKCNFAIYRNVCPLPLSWLSSRTNQIHF